MYNINYYPKLCTKYRVEQIFDRLQNRHSLLLSPVHKLYFHFFCRDVNGISLDERFSSKLRDSGCQQNSVKIRPLLKIQIGLFWLIMLETGTQTFLFPFLNMCGNLFQVRPRGKMKIRVKN